MKACACIKNTNHMIAQARVGEGRGRKVLRKNKRGWLSPFFFFFLLLKALKSTTFIMWYCWALKTDRGIERQRRVCLWRRQMYSSPSSHDLTETGLNTKQHIFFFLFLFCFSLFLSSYLSVCLSCWFQVQHKPSLSAGNAIGGSLEASERSLWMFGGYKLQKVWMDHCSSMHV